MVDPNFGASIEWLFARKPRGRTFGIDRMRVLAEALGHPERVVPCIHVAGTNGKGSVAAMLDAIFRAAGWRVGLYTSPHLVHVGERVQVNRVALAEADLLRELQELRPTAEEIERRDVELAPSFFEYLTAMAFRRFARECCDVAIYEVGLGGRLDATNVVTPGVSVITSIGLDHCELLGDTLAKIAAEKAGIIKRGVPVVVGRVPAEARRVIAEVAAKRGAAIEWVEDRFRVGGEQLPTTNLEGEFQRWNAATATLAAAAFCRSLTAAGAVGHVGQAAHQDAPTADQIGFALQHVHWPGRWERREVGGRTVILDASHNPEGAQTLDANLRRLLASDGRKPHVVVGVLGAARARPLLAVVARHAAAIRLVVLNDPRACTYAALRALIPPSFAGPIIDDSLDRLIPGPGVIALPESDANGKAGTIVVTGSIYLIGEVMKRLG